MSDTAPARSVLVGRVAALGVAGGMAVRWAIAFGTTFRSAWYTLTNKRAFIPTDLPFRGCSLKSDPIIPPTVPDCEAGAPGSIMFNRGMRRRKNGIIALTWALNGSRTAPRSIG